MLMEENPAKRRKLRKGTFSCQDCRRRKVKCVFAEPTDTICIVCKRRGAKCLSQHQPSIAEDDKMDVDNQDDHIDANAHFTVVTATKIVDNASLEQMRPTFDHIPVTMDGARLNEADLQMTRLSRFEGDTHARVREMLMDALPCKLDIILLSQNTSVISASCFQEDYKYHNAATDDTEAQPAPSRSLLSPEGHPTLLARQMLVFASAIRKIPAKGPIPHLTKPVHIIEKELADAAIKLVNMDDSLLGTLESVENLIFELLYHIDCGNIRRAWITSHRAVTTAQMLGLHRPGHPRYTLIKRDSDLDPDVMWSTIVSLERLLSLLLGLPTSTNYMTLSCQPISAEADLGHNLTALVGTLAAKILDRNQIESAQDSLEMTRQIDRNMIAAAEQMSADFWRPITFAELERDSWKAAMETRRAFGHMCYYSLVLQLHLPHMLNPNDVSQRLYSKLACVNASREILNREVEMRNVTSISACCRMTNFMAVIAGMALMLGHTTSHFENDWNHVLAHQRLGDRATVQRALDFDVDPASERNEDVLAVRHAALLKEMLEIEECVAKRHRHRDRHLPADKRDQRDIIIMRVPYLGNIQISQQGVAIISSANGHSVSEGLTIGGIGSVSIGQSPSEDGDSQSRPKIRPDTPILDTQAYTQSSPPNASTNSLFPDAAASFDDWIFQGVDTAFMETLMSGSGVHLKNGFDEEKWNISTFP